MTTPTPFPGFPQAGLDFLAELAAHNTREWFAPRKQDYIRLLRDPALAFVAAIGTRLQTLAPHVRVDLRTNGGGSLMRINRDTRFSKDKSPYKIELPMMLWEGPGRKMEHPGFGIRLRPVGLGIMAGMFGFNKDMLTAYREAVDDPELGAELVALRDTVLASGAYRLNETHYKRVPRGFDADHPRAELLRHNGLWIGMDEGTDIPPEIVTTPDVVDVAFGVCERIAPVQRWLVKVAQKAGL